ncbi:MAG: class I SAM-dependent methyltransferase [Cyclobacteriaceae bacterium]|nr:class I SAM-dependent methyltransferase [Cyclobacteriaceae bacterium]
MKAEENSQKTEKLESIDQCLACGCDTLHHYIDTKAQMHENPEIFSFVKCTACGLVMLNPRVRKSFLKDYYTNFYLPFRGPAAWGKYAPLVAKNLRKTDEKRVMLAKQFADINSKSRVLDVGCGKPTFLYTLHNQTNCYAKGIDFTDEGWKTESEKYANIDLEIAEFQNYSDKTPFDLITMWHYLEHDYDPQKTLRQMLHVVRKDSTLIIEVPNIDSWTYRWQKQHWEGFHTPRHTAIYEPDTITILLNNSGWSVSKIIPYGTLDAYPLFWMGQMEKRGIDWSSSMQSKFIGFVAGMFFTWPFFALKNSLSGGLMTIIAKPKK